MDREATKSSIGQWDYLSPQEQKIIGGSVRNGISGEEWFMPMGLASRSITYAQAESARTDRRLIEGVINRVRPDGQPYQIIVGLELAPLDPESYQTAYDPRVIGTEEIWNAEGINVGSLGYGDLQREFYLERIGFGLAVRNSDVYRSNERM